jgi:type I restriction enzyme R subunit
MTTNTTEPGLEALIVQSLIQNAGYTAGDPKDYNRTYCLDPNQLLQFLRDTQPEALTQLQTSYGDRFEERLYKRIFDQIQTRGIVEVLRDGIKAGETRLTLYYKQPTSNLNPEARDRYDLNRFTITRQLQYSDDRKRLALDMAIFINGLPLITFELKNNLTKQTVQDAIRQYQNDRDPKEPLFSFARCLVHFALDEDLVYMSTHLKGKNSVFLPFNQGHNDGAGNPINPNGIQTDYLWTDILTKPSLSHILEKYAQIIEKPTDDGRKRYELVFPRYHQLNLVRTLLTHAKNHGIQQRYLIQHSAGSGKSNSITWLAHQLVELTDSNNTQPVFDSIIVVTDRRVLDKQIRDNIKQFAQVKGVVEAITEGSKQLRQALEDGKKIIITTVQKFPFVVQEIQALNNQRFAIIIDEAHSSQGGNATAKMSAALSKNQTPKVADVSGTYLEADLPDPEEETLEDQILRIIDDQKLCRNASYFAFTATPKNKTLETFGTQNPTDGKFYPFHTYTMKQAIEEGFIGSMSVWRQVEMLIQRDLMVKSSVEL